MDNTETKEIIETPDEEVVEMHELQPIASLDLDRASRLIESIEHDVRTLRSLLALAGGVSPLSASYIPPMDAAHPVAIDPANTAVPVGFMQVQQRFAEDDAIEGIFDGERMIGHDGKTYQVPPNYASKSKLVEGDPLKLYITKEGKYLYKQLGPIERRTIPGTLRMEGNHYVVDTDEGTTYNVLTACVTYYISLYGLKANDRVMVMVPSDKPSKWAVIDNLI